MRALLDNFILQFDVPATLPYFLRARAQGSSSQSSRWDRDDLSELGSRNDPSRSSHGFAERGVRRGPEAGPFAGRALRCFERKQLNKRPTHLLIRLTSSAVEFMISLGSPSVGSPPQQGLILRSGLFLPFRQMSA